MSDKKPEVEVVAPDAAPVPEEKKIGKKKLLRLLEEEAPHFMYTLMHLELPPMIGRLRLPVVATASKREA